LILLHEIASLVGGIWALTTPDGLAIWAKIHLPNLSESTLVNDLVFYPSVSVFMVLTLLILGLVTPLTITHYLNYMHGKTTVERLGRSGGQGADLDHVKENIIRSGIMNDDSIYSSLVKSDFDRLAEEYKT
jgi:hypothetical protein